MSIRLLPKSQIAELKSKAQQREINEGVKIAERIDGLRKLWSQTEQDFESYKVSTLKRINEEISALEEKKERLSGEVNSKSKELTAFERSLTSWEKRLEKMEEHLDELEKDAMENFELSENARIRAEDNERITANILRETIRKE